MSNDPYPSWWLVTVPRDDQPEFTREVVVLASTWVHGEIRVDTPTRVYVEVGDFKHRSADELERIYREIEGVNDNEGLARHRASGTARLIAEGRNVPDAED